MSANLKITMVKSRANTLRNVQQLNWTFTDMYEDFPVKTIKKLVREDNGMIGVYLEKCKSQDFIKYVEWLQENFGKYGGAWETGGGGSNRIYFTHEKYYNWFMLKWG